MQRHFSDTAFLPRKPSRLNPSHIHAAQARGQVARAAEFGLDPSLVQAGHLGLPRGTVSMPTSPLLGHSHTSAVAELGLDNMLSNELSQSPWESPHTAQPYFGVSTPVETQPFFPEHALPLALSPQIQPHNGDWFGLSAPGASDPLPSSAEELNYPYQPLSGESGSYGQPAFRDQEPAPFVELSNDRPYDEREGAPKDKDDEDEPVGYGPGGRRRRAQVRIACTHCQKACKKCSNTRPCERCVRYGLEDCIDSTRKPRKSGVKRGPYRRRASKFDSQFGIIPSSPYPRMQVQRPEATHPQEPPFDYPDYPPVPDNGFAQTLGKRRRSGVPPPLSSGNVPHRPPLPESQNSYPPGPRTSSNNADSGNASFAIGPSQTTGASTSLASAITSALSAPSLASRPKWINGQRLSTSGNDDLSKRSVPSPLYPKTPTGPFPVSLNVGKGVDPFSRAVSPIRGVQPGPSSGVGMDAAGLLPRWTFGEEIGHPQEADENEACQLAEHGDIALDALFRRESDGLVGEQTPFQPESTDTWTSSQNLDQGSSQPMQRHDDPLSISLSTISSPQTAEHQVTLDSISLANQVGGGGGGGTGAYTPYPFPSKIRKPSLRTLMSASTTTSRAASPTATATAHPLSATLSNPLVLGVSEFDRHGPNGGDQSPTLFDQPMALDDEGLSMVGMQLENWTGWKDSPHPSSAVSDGSGNPDRQVASGQTAHIHAEIGQEPRHGVGGVRNGSDNSLGIMGFDALVQFHNA